jgi:hypothetical protein
MALRPSHYWRKAIQQRASAAPRAAPTCDAAKTLGLLSTAPQPALSWFSRFIAFLTTPFKFLGISGWEETGCEAAGAGYPVRDAQYSTDGFFTIDIALETFTILGTAPPSGRFIRLEVEPGTKAHDACTNHEVVTADRLSFGGPVVIDTDGPFLEVHPDEDFSV